MNCRDGKGQLCTGEATQELVDPDGKIQGRMCREHAWACVIEYRDKLGERWSVTDTERAALIADRDDTAKRLAEVQSRFAKTITTLEEEAYFRAAEARRADKAEAMLRVATTYVECYAGRFPDNVRPEHLTRFRRWRSKDNPKPKSPLREKVDPRDVAILGGDPSL